MKASELKETVIDGGYCIGCGACAVGNDAPFVIKKDKYAKLQAELSPNKNGTEFVPNVCPFSDNSKNEDEIAKPLFGHEAHKNEKIGYYLSTHAGHVVEDSYRKNGSSGGMGSWILKELLTNDYIDGVLHIRERKNVDTTTMFFEYQLSTTVAEIQQGAKSRYYPIELSQVIQMIKERPGRYAIVGIPCFIKSIRLLSTQDAILKERVKFCIGLICGHLKSAHFASMFGWQLGVHPDKLTKIDFRTKLPGSSAIYYGVTASTIEEGEEKNIVSKPVNQLYGSNWGWGLFKYKACDFCDDVLAETADLTIGDAWLPRYMEDHQGTNVLVVRNREIEKLIQNAKNNESVVLEDLSPEEVIKSQQAGLSHRREGLAYRLYQTDKKNEWRPKKRIQPSDKTLDKRKKKIQDLRTIIAANSHIAFQKALEMNSFEVFKEELAPHVQKYRKLYIPSIPKRIVNKLKRLLNS